MVDSPRESTLGSLFVTADSMHLVAGEWWPEEVGEAVRRSVQCGREHKAAYLGASNGDNPDFYEIFVLAAERLGYSCDECRHITARATTEDCEYVATSASLVLLAGGDPHIAWRAATGTGVDKAVRRAAAAGAPGRHVCARSGSSVTIAWRPPPALGRWSGPCPSSRAAQAS